MNRALDADLLLQGRPPKKEGGTAVCGQFLPLSALVVAEKGESPRIVPLHQHGAGRGAAVGRAGGEGHAVGFVEQAAGHGRLKPAAELHQRVGVYIFFKQGVHAIIAA